MTVVAPTLQPAIEALHKYGEAYADALSSIQGHALLEAQRRVERLHAQAAELIEINNSLWGKAGMTVTFEEDSDTIVYRMPDGSQMRHKVTRRDPRIAPRMIDRGRTHVYRAEESTPASDQGERALRIRLEKEVEAYYQSAHRVLKLIGTLPGLSGVRCKPLSIVRNVLIEHADGADAYSFGVGSMGPTIRPIRRAGDSSFLDPGLISNTEAFVGALVRGCQAAVSS